MHGLFLSASGKAERRAEVRPVRTGDPPITGDARPMVLHRLGAISVPTPLAGRLKLWPSSQWRAGPQQFRRTSLRCIPPSTLFFTCCAAFSHS